MHTESIAILRREENRLTALAAGLADAGMEEKAAETIALVNRHIAAISVLEDQSGATIADRIAANRRRDVAGRVKMASNDDFLANVRRLFRVGK